VLVPFKVVLNVYAEKFCRSDGFDIISVYCKLWRGKFLFYILKIHSHGFLSVYYKFVGLKPLRKRGNVILYCIVLGHKIRVISKKNKFSVRD